MFDLRYTFLVLSVIIWVAAILFIVQFTDKVSKGSKVVAEICIEKGCFK